MHQSFLEQTLTSLRIDDGTTTQCTNCQTTLSECDPVTLRLRHADRSLHPDPLACYCLDCAPIGFDELPATAHTEALVEARLGIAQDGQQQATWLIPVSPTIIATTRSTRLVAGAVPEQEVRE